MEHRATALSAVTTERGEGAGPHRGLSTLCTPGVSPCTSVPPTPVTPTASCPSGPYGAHSTFAHGLILPGSPPGLQWRPDTCAPLRATPLCSGSLTLELKQGSGSMPLLGATGAGSVRYPRNAVPREVRPGQPPRNLQWCTLFPTQLTMGRAWGAGGPAVTQARHLSHDRSRGSPFQGRLPSLCWPYKIPGTNPGGHLFL